jgi:hypothetical protein
MGAQIEQDCCGKENEAGYPLKVVCIEKGSVSEPGDQGEETGEGQADAQKAEVLLPTASSSSSQMRRAFHWTRR